MSLMSTSTQELNTVDKLSSDSDYDEPIIAARPDIPRFKNDDANTSIESDFLNDPMMEFRNRTNENTLKVMETDADGSKYVSSA